MCAVALMPYAMLDCWQSLFAHLDVGALPLCLDVSARRLRDDVNTEWMARSFLLHVQAPTQQHKGMHQYKAL